MAPPTVIPTLVARVVGTLLWLGAGTAVADSIDASGQAPHERCGYCHELDGNSRMEGSPRLAGQTVDYLVKQLRDFRSRQRAGTMQATAELLSDAEIAAVARHFNAQSPRSTATLAPAMPDRKIAEQLHRRGDSTRGIPACSSCHGANGEGRGANPRLAGQHAAYLETQLLDFKRGKRRNDVDGVMRAAVSAASEGELQALARYFANFGAAK